jgi:hypothetical protein
MVDSRTQAYWQLIEMLLNNQAQKDEVLNLNQELIEKGLVDEMREVAGYLAAQGDERGCEFLRDLADELATKYGRVTFTCCIDFLLEILWLTVKSNGNQEKVYSFLGEKENQLNTDFLYTLKLYGDEYLNKQTLEVKKNNADIIFDFSNLIQKFPLGERSLNLEIAIAGYEIAGEVYIHNDFPTDQAETLNNLAVIYLQRIEGLKAENVEVAIRCLNAASKIHTRENFPERWATIQNNLGLAYTYRIKDSKE